jgi:hypothetical protein
MLNKISARQDRARGNGIEIVRRYTEDEMAYWTGIRTSPDNARGPHYSHIVYCPFCNEPRYFDRLIAIHIDENHPEQNE